MDIINTEFMSLYHMFPNNTIILTSLYVIFPIIFIVGVSTYKCSNFKKRSSKNKNLNLPIDHKVVSAYKISSEDLDKPTDIDLIQEFRSNTKPDNISSNNIKLDNTKPDNIKIFRNLAQTRKELSSEYELENLTNNLIKISKHVSTTLQSADYLNDAKKKDIISLLDKVPEILNQFKDVELISSKEDLNNKQKESDKLLKTLDSLKLEL